MKLWKQKGKYQSCAEIPVRSLPEIETEYNNFYGPAS